MPRLTPAGTFAALALLGVLPMTTAHAALDCPNTQLLGPPVPVITGRNPLFSVAVDFDEDGDLDLAVTNSDYLAGGGAASVAVLFNDGFGAFSTVVTYPVAANPRGIVAGDFDEDGIVDLAVACAGANRIAVLRGVGAGTFAVPVEYSAPGAPFEIVSGDYDGDGILDLAAALNATPGVVVLRGQGTDGVGNGTFGPPLVAALTQLSMGIVQGDFTGDGILDLIATENYGGAVAVLRGLGAGVTANAGFAAAVHVPAGAEPQSIAVFDFDEDGIKDLAVANGTSGNTKILRGGGSAGIGDGSFATIATLPSGNTSCVAAFDVNADGIADIVSGETGGTAIRRLHVYLGMGAGGVGDGTYFEGAVITVPSPPYRMLVAELNGDAYPELLVSEYQASQIDLLRGGCSGSLPDGRAPRLTDVRDVPADEGGRVYLTWLRSSLDVIGGSVQSYRVWRRIPDAAATTSLAVTAAPAPERMERIETGPRGELLVTYWENLATLAAERLEGYGYTAATPADSSARHPVQSVFFVTAATANIDVFYPSNVDSGASIDNLPPHGPAHLRAGESGATLRTLVWSANTETDVAGYRLERAPSALFTPGEVVVLATQADTEYVETGFVDAAAYRVIALDTSDNASPPSATLTFDAVGVGDVPRLALAGTTPHPARGGSIRIAFSLATDAPARLEVFDAAGRRVVAPSLDGFGPGAHVVAVDRARPLAPGVYWARLTQGAARVGRRVVVVD